MLAPVELLKSTRLSGSSTMTGPLSLHITAEEGRGKVKLGQACSQGMVRLGVFVDASMRQGKVRLG